MAVRLIKALTQSRRVVLGEGVTMELRPLGFAALKAAEARAFRLAQDRLADAGLAADQTVLAGEDADAYRDELTGLAEEILLDALVLKVAVRWDGVEEEDGTPLPLDLRNWQRLRACFPWLADRALQAIRHPMYMLEREGNASAPSSSGN